MEKVVVYPEHVLAGIKKNHRSHPLPDNLRLFGADTETVNGNPHTLQLWDGPDAAMLAAGHVLLENLNALPADKRPYLVYVDKKTILPEFCAYVRPRLRSGGVNVCYFHNFKFDAMVIFADHHLEIYEQGGASEFFLEEDGSPLKKKVAEEPDRVVIFVELLFGKVNAATFTWGRHFMEAGDLRFEGTTILKIFDSLAFTQASLARSLEMFKIPQSKLEAPKDLGRVAHRTPEFENYAKQDVVAQWFLGRKIMDIHERYKVRPSISLPQFMSRVFRHDFFKGADAMDFPPLDVVRAAELSYHGGKNGLYVPAGMYENVTEVDINSAYPWAMRELPSFLKGRYKNVDSWAGPEYAGLYKISGWTDPHAVYPLVFDHSFRRVDGHFDDLWQSSYEIEKMLSADFIRITKISGFIWMPNKGEARNPFRDFVDHFYKLKDETPRDDPYYNFYKIALNALYGKLVGVIEDRELLTLEDKDEAADSKVKLDFKWDAALGRYVKTIIENRAGQMYNPFIASLITGRVRASMYDLEKANNALHSATDSIKTVGKIKGVPGLGGYKEEVTGRCYIFRNKLYLHFTSKNPVDHDFQGKEKKCAVCKKPAYKHIREDGQSLEKVALHAYKGTIQDLYDNRHALLRDGKMSYQFQHVVGLREGLRRGETPANFVMRPEVLNLRRVSR